MEGERVSEGNVVTTSVFEPKVKCLLEEWRKREMRGDGNVTTSFDLQITRNTTVDVGKRRGEGGGGQ